MVEDKGTKWQTSVCQILDNYQNQIQADQEYIAYDIIDRSTRNPKTPWNHSEPKLRRIASLYSQAECFLEES